MIFGFLLVVKLNANVSVIGGNIYIISGRFRPIFRGFKLKNKNVISKSYKYSVGRTIWMYSFLNCNILNDAILSDAKMGISEYNYLIML